MSPGVSTLLVDARPVEHPTARRRGIGRYVTGLLNGLVEVGAPVIGLYGSRVEADTLRETVPGLPLRSWSRQVVREHAEPGTWYLATQLMLHPIPLDPIPSVIAEARLPVAAVMYDVIPYRHPDRLVDANARRQAALRAPLARTVDTLLAISEFARATAAEALEYPVDRIAVIGAGADVKFAPPTDDPRVRSRRVLPAKVGAYVVAVTGGDEHKNTEGLLRAWEYVERALGGTHHLVIATGHTPGVLARWQRCAAEAGVTERVVFTGRLDDDELVAVLQGAALAVTPSIEEGFGLPVLEAAACGVPAIASDVSSLPEVLDEPLATFDPHDPESIADAVVEALGDRRALLLEAGERAVGRWTWSKAAGATLEGLRIAGPRWPQRVVGPQPRVAIAAPRAGDHDHAAALAAAVREVGPDTTLFVDGSASVSPTGASPTRWPVRALGRFLKPWDYDQIVAVLGEPGRHLGVRQLAGDVPCHLWVGGDVGAQCAADRRAFENARSFIVGSDEDAHEVRRIVPAPRPVLVLDDDAPIAATAASLVAWLSEVDELDPATIRHL